VVTTSITTVGLCGEPVNSSHHRRKVLTIAQAADSGAKKAAITKYNRGCENQHHWLLLFIRARPGLWDANEESRSARLRLQWLGETSLESDHDLADSAGAVAGNPQFLFE
jgi:hypothetical protein